jgi:GMP synthase PP-ATPase subunit
LSFILGTILFDFIFNQASKKENKIKTMHNKGIEPTGNKVAGFLQKLVAPVGSCPVLCL